MKRISNIILSSLLVGVLRAALLLPLGADKKALSNQTLAEYREKMKAQPLGVWIGMVKIGLVLLLWGAALSLRFSPWFGAALVLGAVLAAVWPVKVPQPPTQPPTPQN